MVGEEREFSYYNLVIKRMARGDGNIWIES